jgi:beta-lactamase regulating signal transducer with metallopeptidase domain
VELRLLFGTELGPWASLSALGVTYLAHSVVWAAAVALLACSKALSAATRSSYWKAALFGPLLSAWLATNASFGVFQHSLDGSSLGDMPAASLEPNTADKAGSAPAHRSAVRVAAAHLPGAPTLVVLSLLGICTGLLRFGASAYVLKRSLRGRAPVTDARILRRFARLRGRMKLGLVRLTESDALRSPLVIGAREVCVPRGLFSELALSEIDAVLAHELAHIERKDGVWFPLVTAVQSALWLQPLNHLVASYFRRGAELACDDRAVELTGCRLGLARALVHVAERASQARQPAFLPTMVRHQSALLWRVRRLTSAHAPFDATAGIRTPDRWQASLKLLAIGAALATLSVRVASARTESSVSGERNVEPGAVVSPASLPDVAAHGARMAELAAREQALVAELSALEAWPQANVVGSPEALRALELSQELRHVRGTQAWLEERFIAGWTAFEARSTVRR